MTQVHEERDLDVYKKKDTDVVIFIAGVSSYTPGIGNCPPSSGASGVCCGGSRLCRSRVQGIFAPVQRIRLACRMSC